MQTRMTVVLVVLAAVGLASGCKKKAMREQVVAISGPLCTAHLSSGETNHCDKAPSCSVLDDASRCMEMVSSSYTDTSSTLGTVYWKAWWLRPKNRTQAQVANRVPILFAHGMSMNNGWTPSLKAAAALADVTGRPVLVTAEIVAAPNSSGYGIAYTSQSVSFLGKGDVFGARWLKDLGATGTGVNNWTWEGATGKKTCSSDADTKALELYKTGYRPDGKTQVTVCANFGTIRAATTYVRTAPWTFQDARRLAIANGLVSATTKFDAVAHSQGTVAIAAALANNNGLHAGPTDQYFSSSHANGFASNIRNVIALNGPNLGAIDTALGDLRSISSGNNGNASRPAFIQTWNYWGSPVNKPKWYAVATSSCGRFRYDQPAPCVSDTAGNYMFGMVCTDDLGTIPNFLGTRTSTGDGVVPLASQYSPWLNSVGVSGGTVGGSSTKFYKRLVYDCIQSKTTTTTSGTTTAFSPNYGARSLLSWNGSHQWTVTSQVGWAEWLPVLEAACVGSGASCQYEVSCYTGASGTEGVGECRKGHRLTSESTSVCHGQVLPATEVCDGKDNDCDGTIDEGNTTSRYADVDEDGYGAGSLLSITGCNGIDYPGHSTVAGDCYPLASNANPGVPPSTYTFHGVTSGSSNSFDLNCDGTPEPHCGDYTCDTADGETIVNCASDCPASSYSAGNTNYAAYNTVDFVWGLSQGERLQVSTCVSGASASGNTYWRLLNMGTTVAYGYQAWCGPIIDYVAPSSGNYTLKRGCAGYESCSALMGWTVNGQNRGKVSDSGTMYVPPSGGGGGSGGGDRFGSY